MQVGLCKIYCCKDAEYFSYTIGKVSNETLTYLQTHVGDLDDDDYQESMIYDIVSNSEEEEISEVVFESMPIRIDFVNC